MKPSLLYPWIAATVATIALPLLGFFIFGIWWRSTFSWDVNHVPPFYWNIVFIFAVILITATPVPLVWTAISHFRKKNLHHIPLADPR